VEDQGTREAGACGDAVPRLRRSQSLPGGASVVASTVEAAVGSITADSITADSIGSAAASVLGLSVGSSSAPRSRTRTMAIPTPYGYPYPYPVYADPVYVPAPVYQLQVSVAPSVQRDVCYTGVAATTCKAMG
jgi:hypothetical protein